MNQEIQAVVSFNRADPLGETAVLLDPEPGNLDAAQYADLLEEIVTRLYVYRADFMQAWAADMATRIGGHHV
jgi:hypothetical protein